MPIDPKTAASVAKSLLTPAAKVLRDRYEQRREQRNREAWETLAGELAFAASSSAVDAIIADADVQSVDLLEEYFLNWMLLVDPSTKKYVARLTSTYIVEKAVRDPFFRRAGELLRDADREDIAALVELCARIGQLLHEYERNHPADASFEVLVIDEGDAHIVRVMRSRRDGTPLAQSPLCEGGIHGAIRLIRDHRLCDSTSREETMRLTYFSGATLTYARKLITLFG
jgi:hypothetical protein